MRKDKEIGLTTGGLDTGSLSDKPKSARDSIAEEYAPLLSGEKGARAQFDAFLELINTEIQAKEDAKVVSTVGATTMAGFGDFMSIKTKKIRGGGSGVIADEEPSDVQVPWGLVSVDDDEYSIQVGNIYTDFGSVSDDTILDIIDFDASFSLSASTVIYLDLEIADPPVLTLRAGSAWTEYPLTFKLTTSGVVKAERAYFRLWHGVSGDKPANKIGRQFDGFWMQRTCRSNDLVLAFGDHELDGGNRHISVPILFPM
jgi:hypothetical protein